MSSNLEGRIKGLSLSAFLQMSEMEEHSCTLRITSNTNEIGLLYLQKGKLIAAETRELKNLDAAYQIISWDEPIIEIEKESQKTVNEINMPLMNILMDGLRVKDENKAGQPSLTFSETVNDNTQKADLHLDDEEDELELELDLDPEFQPLEFEDVLTDNDNKTEISDSKNRMPDSVIEQRIRDFQNQIAIQCPVCAAGKILQKISEEKIPYFACSNPTCGFISRNKPYKLNCPKCNNSFLIEFMINGKNHLGLKCPRQECSFQQNSLTPPSRDPLRGPTEDKQPRTYRVIRKKPRL